MAVRTLNERKARSLTDARVRHAKPGKHYDLNGLFLLVESGGSRRWVQRIVIQGKRRDLGLGSYPLVSLAEAREAAAGNRKVARAGGDPTARASGPIVPTFAEAADQGHRDAHPGMEERRQDGQAVARIASRLCDGENRRPSCERHHVRGRDEHPVADLVDEAGHREEGARTHRRGHEVVDCERLQGRQPRGRRGGSRATEEWSGPEPFPGAPSWRSGDALARVRASGAYRATVLAFEFLVLTACRSGDVRGATWDEVDLENAVWAIPGARMKVYRAHRVPLSSGARAILLQAMALKDRSNLVFPSVTGRPLSDSTISKLVRENGITAVPHGFRSSFRDWCGECSGAPREVAEAALAHAVGGVEGAYARSDLFERRRTLMQAWSDYLGYSPRKT